MNDFIKVSPLKLLEMSSGDGLGKGKSWCTYGKGRSWKKLHA